MCAGARVCVCVHLSVRVYMFENLAEVNDKDSLPHIFLPRILLCELSRCRNTNISDGGHSVYKWACSSLVS